LILNIYVPNAPQEHPPFWNNIQHKLTKLHVPTIDVILGDFNITEDIIDRIPTRYDDYSAVEAIHTFRESLNMIDSWRHSNPNTQQFTFISNTHSLSRLDRIYTNRNLSNHLSDWEVTDTIIPSDHKMVLARLVPPTIPFIGPGRWTTPLALLTNNDLLNQITDIGKTLQQELEFSAHTDTSPQTQWSEFKQQMTTMIKESSKHQLAKMRNKMMAIEKDIRSTEQCEDLDTDRNQRSNIAFLRHKLQYLNQKINRNARAKAQAKWFEKGEKINRYWINLHKPRKPRDPIYALSDPTSNKITTKSSNMAEITRKYHDDLQSKHLPHHTDPERQTTITEVLQQIPNPQKFDVLDSDLCHLISQEQVSLARLASKNGSATGPDSLPYELWKTLHDLHIQLSKKDTPSINIIKCLTIVYNNIQILGTNEADNFASGWMCPLYKKKDRTKIDVTDPH
jgi:hypothetical protein